MMRSLFAVVGAVLSVLAVAYYAISKLAELPTDVYEDLAAAVAAIREALGSPASPDDVEAALIGWYKAKPAFKVHLTEDEFIAVGLYWYDLIQATTEEMTAAGFNG